MRTSARASRRRSLARGLALAVLACCGACIGSPGDGPPEPPAPSFRCASQQTATRVPNEAGAGSCTFALGSPPDGGASHDCDRITIDGVTIAQTPLHTGGWDYTDASHLTIQLYGAPCATAQANPSSVVTAGYFCCGID